MACACTAHMASTTAQLVLVASWQGGVYQTSLNPCTLHPGFAVFVKPTLDRGLFRYPSKLRFGLVWQDLRANTSGTRSASCSSTGSGISKLINYHRMFISVQLASKHDCHPHPTSLPSLAEQRGLLAMAAMACRPPGPHSPFGQRRELRIVSYNTGMSEWWEDSLQQPKQQPTNDVSTAREQIAATIPDAATN